MSDLLKRFSNYNKINKIIETSWDFVFNDLDCLQNENERHFILNIVQWIRFLTVHLTWVCELKDKIKWEIETGNFILSSVTFMGSGEET